MRERKIVGAVLTGILLLAILYCFAPGFLRETSACVVDYSLAEDGRELCIRLGVSASSGYIREVKVSQSAGGKLYLDCYAAFGGINGSLGAQSEFRIPISKDTWMLAFYRGNGCYQTVLEKNAAGEWHRPGS